MTAEATALLRVVAEHEQGRDVGQVAGLQQDRRHVTARSRVAPIVSITS